MVSISWIKQGIYHFSMGLYAHFKNRVEKYFLNELGIKRSQFPISKSCNCEDIMTRPWSLILDVAVLPIPLPNDRLAFSTRLLNGSSKHCCFHSVV